MVENNVKETVEMNDNTYTLNVTAERIKGEKDGKKYDFISCSSVDKKGFKCRVKFAKDCKNQPEKEGKYIVIVNKENIFKDKRTVRYTVVITEILNIEKVEKFTVAQDKKEELDF